MTVATGALALVVGGAPASAARPATPAERAEMVPSFGYQMVDERCAAATVSTVPGGEVWARVDAVSPAPEGCRAARQQYLVLHRTGRTVDPWASALYGFPGERLRRCADFLIPDAVGADLATCTGSTTLARDARSRTTIGCWNARRGTRLTHTRRPKRCVVSTSTGSIGSGFELRDVRWSTWGGRTARGTGMVREFRSGWYEGRARRLRFTATTVIRRGASRSYQHFRVAGIPRNRSVVVPTTRGPRR